ncbi:hypothetical protein RRG08_009423 [Elysia crispata]|uniref:Uncharacterized protein n=1 Tax=Elysia crispata TaxID=231223 RepID=A0AAE1CUA5_9GAST|nr:hypothetical protein RRG08_009423 [Elysia crispata]
MSRLAESVMTQDPNSDMTRKADEIAQRQQAKNYGDRKAAEGGMADRTDIEMEKRARAVPLNPKPRRMAAPVESYHEIIVEHHRGPCRVSLPYYQRTRPAFSRPGSSYNSAVTQCTCSAGPLTHKYINGCGKVRSLDADDEISFIGFRAGRVPDRCWRLSQFEHDSLPLVLVVLLG